MTYVEVKIPQQGLTVDSVTLSRWLKEEGERVSEGEPLYEIVSDKANLEVEATATGRLARILKSTDDEAAIGEVVGLIEVEA